MRIFFSFLIAAIFLIMGLMFFIEAHERAHQLTCSYLGGKAGAVVCNMNNCSTTCGSLPDNESKKIWAAMTGMTELYDYRIMGIYVIGSSLMFFAVYGFLGKK